MSYKIIVARYNEDIKWLNTEINNCIIYNKGEKLNIDNEIMLENVGRESETYLHYIITNYNNLPDVIVFTQARIADHVGANNIKYLIKIKNEALKFKISQNYLTHYETSSNIKSCWNKEWNYLPYYDNTFVYSTNNEYYLQHNYKNNKPIKFIEWFETNIDKQYPNPIFIYYAAIFSVKKENILNRPIEYYKKLILEVNHHINSTEGHFFERSWYYIFNPV
jgi:hypothetical protein